VCVKSLPAPQGAWRPIPAAPGELSS
jgi:hypothetical protein